MENVQKDKASLAQIQKLHSLLEELQPRLEIGLESCHDVGHREGHLASCGEQNLGGLFRLMVPTELSQQPQAPA